MFSTLKMLAVFAGFGTVAGVVGIPYSILVGNVRLLYRVVMWIMRTGVRAGGIRVEVTGLENVPAGVSCIFLPNHLSNLDPPIIFPVIPPMASVLLKKELMSIPLLGVAMRMGRFVPVDRANSREAARASVAAAAKAIRDGLHMLVFAEGTRSKDGRLQTFKRGPFYLAEETGAPIVPVVITGTERMMQKGSWAVTPGVARVRMLPAMWPSDYDSRDALLQAVRAEMIAALPEEMRPVQPGDSVEGKVRD